MITRAQAEALLTLAESLEACERLSMSIPIDEYEGLSVFYTRDQMSWFDLPDLKSMSLRLAVNALIPKQET